MAVTSRGPGRGGRGSRAGLKGVCRRQGSGCCLFAKREVSWGRKSPAGVEAGVGPCAGEGGARVSEGCGAVTGSAVVRAGHQDTGV